MDLYMIQKQASYYKWRGCLTVFYYQHCQYFENEIRRPKAVHLEAKLHARVLLAQLRTIHPPFDSGVSIPHCVIDGVEERRNAHCTSPLHSNMKPNRHVFIDSAFDHANFTSPKQLHCALRPIIDIFHFACRFALLNVSERCQGHYLYRMGALRPREAESCLNVRGLC